MDARNSSELFFHPQIHCRALVLHLAVAAPSAVHPSQPEEVQTMHTVAMRTPDMLPTTGITLPLAMELKPGTKFALAVL